MLFQTVILNMFSDKNVVNNVWLLAPNPPPPKKHQVAPDTVLGHFSVEHPHMHQCKNLINQTFLLEPLTDF